MSNIDTKNEILKRNIPFSPPDISELEIAEVAEALRSGWITTGPRTKELERRLAEYCHTSRAVCLNSATAAEELNFRICGIGDGDEVIVPSYTYTASASAAIHCGAKVIFVDSQKDSTEMDYDKVAEVITEKTKAVVAVDLGGIICDYDKLYAAVESKLQNVIALGQEFSSLSVGYLCSLIVLMRGGQAEMERWLVRLLTSVISHSML